MKSARIFGFLFLICMWLSGSSALAITPLKPYAPIKEASAGPSKPETSSMLTSHVPDASNKATMIKSYGRLPLSFQRNDGQAPDEVKFLARWGGRVYWFMPKEVVLDFAEKENSDDKVANLRPTGLPEKQDKTIKRHMVRISFPGANPDVKIEGLEEQEGKVNYFIGSDKSKWRANVPIYSGVIYRNIWPGIDLKYEGRGGNLKYEFVVAPGADPGVVRLAYEGIESMRVSDAGDLALSTKLGDLTEARPVVYQVQDGTKIEITSSYRITEDGRVGFSMGQYDPRLPLIIDPLVYSTYLGGQEGYQDRGLSIAVDGSRNAYVTGYTISTDFPTQNALQPANANPGYWDAFVTKITPRTATHVLISGLLKDANNIAITNAFLTFSNGAGTAYSDSNGYYAHSVPVGWNGTVVPGPDVYWFYPGQRVYTNVQWDRTNQHYLVGYRLNLSLSPLYSGTVSPIPQIPTTGLYPLNQSLTFLAAPNYGYAFSHWSGDASGTANHLFNFIMNSHKSVTAHFQEIAGQLVTISGTVRDTSANPIENADITFVSGNVTSIVKTNGSGYYEIRVALGWSGTSSAQKTGYTFSPQSISYSNVTQNMANEDFTGTPAQSERDCRAIIVAGSGDQNDPLWPAINHLGNLAYRSMLYKGIAKENIRYFNAKTNQDVDGNGNATDDIHGPPSSAALQDAILSWAMGYVNQDKPLMLYMVDHGITDQFYLVKQPPDMLSSSQLNGWLNQVQNTKGCKVIVLYEACHSGSFLDDLIPPPGQRRIVISSAQPDQQAYFGSEGRVSFSQSFWTSTLMGNHVRKCFLDARGATAYATNNRQYAMLDDSGDGVWDSHADGQLAQVTYIGDPFVTGAMLPVMTGAMLPETIEKTRDLFLPTGASHTFYAKVQPGFAPVERVRCVVVPPGAGGGSTTVPVTDLPTFELSYNASTDRYKGAYSGFATAGTYKITFYAEDTYGNISLPESTEVQVVGEEGSFPVYRFWSAVYNSHHYTISALERDYILEHWPDTWTYEGIGFYARVSGEGGTLAVYRFWSDIFHSHHYTISEWERDFIIQTWPEAWSYEGIAFYAYASPQEGALPVYRFWSEIFRSHHYTISAWERDYIINTWPEAWTYEGIGFYMYVAP